MTPIAFLFLFISVFLHAGWNFLSKKKMPSLSFYALSCTTAALLLLPGFIWSGFELDTLPLHFWRIWLCSVGCEVLYAIGLAYAYRRGDISLVYPMARALPVLMTAVLTILFGLGSPPGPPALTGMIILSFGCLLMPLTRWRDFKMSSYRGKALRFILLAAIGTTGYTVLDSIAIRIVRDIHPESNFFNSISYLFLIETGIATVLFALVYFSKRERAELRKLFLKSKTPVISGIFSASAYVLILLAMGHVTNVSYVQAFRQMSLPLGVLAGIFLLHEKPGKPRLAGIGLVIIGLIIISFS